MNHFDAIEVEDPRGFQELRTTPTKREKLKSLLRVSPTTSFSLNPLAEEFHPRHPSIIPSPPLSAEEDEDPIADVESDSVEVVDTAPDAEVAEVEDVPAADHYSQADDSSTASEAEEEEDPVAVTPSPPIPAVRRSVRQRQPPERYEAPNFKLKMSIQLCDYMLAKVGTHGCGEFAGSLIQNLTPD